LIGVILISAQVKKEALNTIRILLGFPEKWNQKTSQEHHK